MISRLTNKTRAWNKISNNRLSQILNQTKLKTMLKFCLCSSQGKSSPCPSGSPFVPSTSSSHVIPSTSSSSEASATSEGVGSGHRQRRVFCLRCGLDPLTPRTFLWWSLHPLTPLTTNRAQTCNWGGCGQYATSLKKCWLKKCWLKQTNNKTVFCRNLG